MICSLTIVHTSLTQTVSDVGYCFGGEEKYSGDVIWREWYDIGEKITLNDEHSKQHGIPIGSS